jgi:hypothetical protein
LAGRIGFIAFEDENSPTTVSIQIDFYWTNLMNLLEVKNLKSHFPVNYGLFSRVPLLPH